MQGTWKAQMTLTKQAVQHQNTANSPAGAAASHISSGNSSATQSAHNMADVLALHLLLLSDCHAKSIALLPSISTFVKLHRTWHVWKSHAPCLLHLCSCALHSRCA
jgi:hypothetical protein